MLTCSSPCKLVDESRLDFDGSHESLQTKWTQVVAAAAVFVKQQIGHFHDHGLNDKPLAHLSLMIWFGWVFFGISACWYHPHHGSPTRLDRSNTGLLRRKTQHFTNIKGEADVTSWKSSDPNNTMMNPLIPRSTASYPLGFQLCALFVSWFVSIKSWSSSGVFNLCKIPIGGNYLII